MTYAELVKKANEASDAYYNGGQELMTNREWDELFDEISRIEKETGIISPDSPTQKTGSDGKGKKELHEFPALSLAKTKSMDDLIAWAGGLPVYVSWKLDGLTLVATYDNGKLSRLLTRGNGSVGTNITHLAPAISGIPQEISHKGHLVVRGEALISYEDFRRINDEIEDEEEKYANPRNLASGTLNLDDIAEVKRRNVHMIAFTPVYIENNGASRFDTWSGRMNYLDELGFDTVKRTGCCSASDIRAVVDSFTQDVNGYAYPVDGLVLCYQDWNYSQTGSVTGHHATRAGYAFKWQDETKETTLRAIEWSASRTGLINPVAVFDPVELCGTTVSRASVHNVSEVLKLDLKIGDKIAVYKANMIIPQIAQNLSQENIWDGTLCSAETEQMLNRPEFPSVCPVCGSSVAFERSAQTKCVTAHCQNPHCAAKELHRFVHFCDRENMNIMGLSEAKLEELIDNGYLKEFIDLYRLADEYRLTGEMRNAAGKPLSAREGWGKRSVENLANAIDASRKTDFIRFLAALGIPNVGHGQAKLILNALLENDPAVLGASIEEQKHILEKFLYVLSSPDGNFVKVAGIGPVIEKSLEDWYDSLGLSPNSPFVQLAKALDMKDEKPKVKQATGITGKTFVITGDVHVFKNRKELQEKIEELGGKATGSVTKKTDFLINNDVNSASSKNKKAKELGIPVISENDFLAMIQ